MKRIEDEGLASIDSPFVKMWLVAQLFLGDLMDKNRTSENLEWISVIHRLPEPNQRILFYASDSDKVFCGVYSFKYSDEKFHFFENMNDWCFEDQVVTHWMPLPNAPGESNDLDKG